MNTLKKKRKELGITQIQAANACGVSRRTYQTYEETENINDTYDDLVKKLEEMGIIDGSNYVPSVRHIKNVIREYFFDKRLEIECAYLYGSYARGEATGKSDIEMLIVSTCSPTINELVQKIEKELHKRIIIHNYKELMQNENLLKEILIKGIKIY